MLVDHCAALGADDPRPGHGQSADGLAGRRHHGHELTEPDTLGASGDRELHRHRLVAVGEAGAAGCQRQCAPVGQPCGRGGAGLQANEAQRLDVELVRIDDAEHHRTRRRHLTGHRRPLGDHAVHRGDQLFGRAANRVEGGAAVLQAGELGAGVLQCRLRHRAGRGEALVAGNLAAGDGDLLVEIALGLAHVGEIDRLDRRRDGGEHLTLADPRAEIREAAGRGGEAAADRRLHDAAGIRIGDDAPRQFDGPAMVGDAGDAGAQSEQALRRFRDEHRAARQAPGALDGHGRGRGERRALDRSGLPFAGPIFLVIMSLMGEGGGAEEQRQGQC